jgi:hypothetical protein
MGTNGDKSLPTGAPGSVRPTEQSGERMLAEAPSRSDGRAEHAAFAAKAAS